jgi:hypothetical protein
MNQIAYIVPQFFLHSYLRLLLPVCRNVSSPNLLTWCLLILSFCQRNITTSWRLSNFIVWDTAHSHQGCQTLEPQAFLSFDQERHRRGRSHPGASHVWPLVKLNYKGYSWSSYVTSDVSWLSVSECLWKNLRLSSTKTKRVPISIVNIFVLMLHRICNDLGFHCIVNDCWMSWDRYS